MICLITLDRFLVLKFPFSSVRFKGKSALAATALAWMVERASPGDLVVTLGAGSVSQLSRQLVNALKGGASS